MAAEIKHVITVIMGNSNGGQSVSQAAPKLKSVVDKVFAISSGDGATDDMKLIASGRSSQINVPEMNFLGEFIRLVLNDRLNYSRRQNLKPMLGTLFYYTADVMLD